MESLGEIRAGDPAAAKFAEFGPGSRMSGPQIALFNPGGVAIGANVYIRSYVCMEVYAHPGSVLLRFGDGVQIGHYVRFVAFNGIELEELVGIGHGCTIGDSTHDWKGVEETDGVARWSTGPKMGRTTLIKKGAWFGNNCVIAGGITVGEWAIIDHGTILNRNVPPQSIVGGYPARVLRVRRDDGGWDILDDPPLLEDYAAPAR